MFREPGRSAPSLLCGPVHGYAAEQRGVLVYGDLHAGRLVARLAEGLLAQYLVGLGVDDHHYGVVAVGPGRDKRVLAIRGEGQVMRERALGGQVYPALYRLFLDVDYDELHLALADRGIGLGALRADLELVGGRYPVLGLVRVRAALVDEGADVGYFLLDLLGLPVEHKNLALYHVGHEGDVV